MKLRICLVIVSAVLPVLAAEPDPSPTGLPTVVLLGDSIRMNYQAAVTEALESKAITAAPKDNCGDTVNILANLDRWLAGHEQARVIHFNVGLHDMFLGTNTNEPRHTLETYEKNLRAIFAKLDELSDAQVIFALTTAVNEELQAESETYGRVVRRNEDVEAYNAIARSVAEELGIPVNDLNSFMKEAGPEKILRPSDGIHLSPEGCEIMGTEVARVILENLADSPTGK